MKWLLLTCFLLWARHGEGGALKCLPGDAECLSQLSEEEELQEIEIRRPSGSTDAPFECLPGSEWESNCHRCRCLDGEAQCLRQPGCESIDEPIRCAPNSTFERECNTCVCLGSGLGLCTVEPCERIPSESPETPVPSKVNIVKGVDCAPGTAWQTQCNDCVCSPDGFRHCTERVCPGQEFEPLLRCAPQSQWKYDCNMCWCNSGRAMCTKMGCAGISVEMFDEGETSDSEELPEPNELPEVPALKFNDLLESDTKDNYMYENLEDLDATTDPLEEHLNGVNLKDLDDYDHNDIDSPLKPPDQVMIGFSPNIDTKFRTEDEELLEDLLNNDNHETTAEHMPQNSEGDSKHVEVLDDSYINNNQRNTRVKRSPCKPNQEFQNECNTCKCSANGEVVTCTQNECMDRDKEEVDKDYVDKEVEVFAESEGADHIQRHSVCKPSEEFFKGCNPCHCNSDGTDFSCTNKPCDPDVEVFHELHILKSAKNMTKKVCVENRMFIMDCNTCWCNEDGTSYFCTRKVCQDSEPIVEGPEGLKSSKNSTKKVCVENRMFIMDCNTCWCNEDGTSYFCTRKVCQDSEPIVEGPEQKLRITQRDCKPDEVFEVDCNMCRCNADGKSFSCTRRACVDADSKNQTVSRKTRATPQEERKNCLPGQEFRLDCNKCLCDNMGQDFSCTRIDCAALNNHNNGDRRKREVSAKKVPTDCIPGSVFDQACNVCRCTVDGKHATCTLKRCPGKENSTLTATESSFRCNPGEQFKQSCNDCSCSADGKSVFCTLRVCDEDLAP